MVRAVRIDRQHLIARLRAYAHLTRLHRPADLPLLLLPALSGLWLASAGQPKYLSVVLVVVAVLAARCAAWAFVTVADSGQLALGALRHPLVAWRVLAPPVRWALKTVAVLGLVALGLAAWINVVALVVGLIGAVAFPAFPFVRRRSYMAEPFLATLVASTVLFGFAAGAGLPSRGAWLLAVAVMLWATAWSALLAVSEMAHTARRGLRSLVMLLGESDRQAVAALQLGGLFALWLFGRQESLGVFFTIALVVMFFLLIYQQFLLLRRHAEAYYRAYLNNIWVAVTLFCGIAFHFLCQGTHC